MTTVVQHLELGIALEHPLWDGGTERAWIRVRITSGKCFMALWSPGRNDQPAPKPLANDCPVGREMTVWVFVFAKARWPLIGDLGRDCE